MSTDPEIRGVDQDRNVALVAARFHIFLALTSALLAGGLSVLMRWQVGLDGRKLPLAEALGLFPATNGVIPPEVYSQLFTLHGAGMFFFVLLPALGPGFGSLALGLQRHWLPTGVGWFLGAGAVLHGLGWVCLVISPIGAGSGPAAGWSYYPPLSRAEWSPGYGMDWFLGALGLWGLGAVLTAAGQIAGWLIRQKNADGRLSFWNLGPQMVGQLAACLSTVLAVPSLLVSLSLLLSDRHLGTGFFDPLRGTPVLHQHLFWFFAHPAVYILILPVMGWFTQQLLPPEWTGRWPHWLSNGCMAAIAVLGFAAWGHHMFQSGLDPRISGRFSIATLLISWPSALLVGLWLIMASGSAKRRNRTTGYWHGLAFLITFSLGGVGGILLATAPMNGHLHGTYWVVGHIHLVLFGGTVLGLSSMFFLYSGEVLKRSIPCGQMLVHLVMTVPLLILVFGLMHWLGYMGLGRRLYQVVDVSIKAATQPVNQATTWAAFALVTVQSMLGVSLLYGLGWMDERWSRNGLSIVALITVVPGWMCVRALGSMAGVGLAALMVGGILLCSIMWGLRLLWDAGSHSTAEPLPGIIGRNQEHDERTL